MLNFQFILSFLKHQYHFRRNTLCGYTKYFRTEKQEPGYLARGKTPSMRSLNGILPIFEPNFPISPVFALRSPLINFPIIHSWSANGRMAFAGTSGTEAAFSHSRDNGRTWNQ